MSDYIYKDGELCHYGILGQKWGIRRFQNEDGSLTSEGLKRYRVNNVGSNIGRAITNTSGGQKLSVSLNKGYREDKKEINRVSKELRRNAKNVPLDKKNQSMVELRKQYLKQIKNDTKMSKQEARLSAAEAIYPWQTEAMRNRVQTASFGKQYVQTLLTGGGGGSLAYDSLRSKGVSRLASAGAGVAVNLLDSAFGAASIGNYIYKKTKYNKEHDI